MLIFDAHLDLALNALEWNRDLTQEICAIRERESGMTDKRGRGEGTVAFPEMRRGGVNLCVGTQFARYTKPYNPLPGWHSPEQAWAQTQGQLAWYRAMEEAGELIQIANARELTGFLSLLERTPIKTKPIGYILSLEGADSIVSINHIERSYDDGLRVLGPAHYGDGVYAQSGLDHRGRALLKEMDRLGMILDVTHFCEESFWEALDNFEGPVWASHSNCRTLVPGPSQLGDDQIMALIDRGAVIGTTLDACMLYPGWKPGRTTPAEAGLKMEAGLDHIDHVNQLSGNAHHSGIGSDLDGTFGREQTPEDLDTISDLKRISKMLRARGYNEEDTANVLHSNFIRFLKKAWESS